MTPPERLPAALELRGAAEALLLAAFRSSRDALILFRSEDELIVDVNDAWCDTTGYRREEVIGKPQTELNIWADEDSQRFARQMRADGEVRDFRFSFRRRLPSGRTARGYASLEAQPVELNGVQYSLVSGRDLTAEVEGEARRQQASRLEELGRLAGGVAHDVNNLLTVIGAHALFARNAVQRGELPELEDLEGIGQTIQRAAALTTRLLAFSRNQVIEPRVLDLNEVTRDASAMLERLLGAHVVLRTELDPELPPILADPIQVDQVLVNLAVNARDAMPNGGTITVRTRRERVLAEGDSPAPSGEYAILEVEDTGGGMDEETRERIFEPFFTTKGLAGGTGLGLAMVYGIIKQAGGSVSVETAPGEGTTFQLFWPVAEELAQLEREAPDRDAAEPSGGRVLLVEDDDSVRVAICRFLKQSGYEVVEARNGAEALLRFDDRGGAVDLVLTDVAMPVMDGRDLAQRLASQAPSLPVVMISGYTTRGNVRAGLPNVRGPVLTKPFDEEALLRALREARGGRAG